MNFRNPLAFCMCLAAVACSRNSAPAGAAAAAARSIADGSALVTAMHDRYASTWYSTLRFRQTVTNTRNGKEQPPQVMLEHAMIPGYLRIDLGHDYTGNGVIYAPDSLYSFQNGKLGGKRKTRNILMILGFDVYRQPVTRSLQVLREEGYDLTKLHMDTWQGKDVYVVGADAGDLHHKQFWIEKDRMLFVRALEPARDTTKTMEYRFDNYQPLGKAWLAVKCVFLTDGVETGREEYFDIEGNPKLPAGLMDPAQWGTAMPVK